MATNNRKSVVVLGTGYAGASAAKNLDKASGVDVTVVSPTESFALHKIGALRAAVKGGSWVERALIPTDKLVGYGTLVRGKAKSVNAAAKTVTLEDGTELKFDALVIATGSRNVSPGDLPKSATTKEAAAKYFAEMKSALTSTKNVVIVGSGAVAIELASEIREFGQTGAKITLVTRAKQILTDGIKYRPSGIKTLEKDLKGLNVDIIYEDEVVSHTLDGKDLGEVSPLVKTPEGVTLKSGKKIASDLLVYAVGSKLNTEFLPADWLDKGTGEVIVDGKTLQVVGHSNIFAVGDIAKAGTAKRGYFAGEDGKVVAKNVVQVLAGKAPTNKIQRMDMIAVNLGSKGGRVLLPFMTLGPWMTANMKSKKLFAEKFWGDIATGAKVPPIS